MEKSFKEENEVINQLSKNMENGVQNCLDCYRRCTGCLQHCLFLTEEHRAPEHIDLLIQCADICRVASKFMMSMSPFSHEICGICARVCDACADSCLDIDSHDSVMSACAEACRKCADSCRTLEH